MSPGTPAVERRSTEPANPLTGSASDESVVIGVRGLTVTFATPSGPLRAVDAVDLDLRRGEILGVMGESGCGKSTLALALLNALPDGASVTGQVWYRDFGNVLAMPRGKLRRLRWERISLVFQGAQNSLDPIERIGKQVVTLGEAHGRRGKEIRSQAQQLCTRLRLDPNRVLNAYPHELSGGMKQRVEIMLALVLNPDVVIFDEPTTALDTVTQDLVLRLIREMKEELGITAVFITHDVAVLAELATSVAVMYAGNIVERSPAEQLFADPRHPYTDALMRSIPRLTGNPYDARGLPGEPPKLIGDVSECAFRFRCSNARERCAEQRPPLLSIGADRDAACFFPVRRD